VLRQVQRHFQLNGDWLIWPHKTVEMPESVKRLIIVDDFIGSGEQFTEFATSVKLRELMTSRPKLDVVYLAAAGTESGVAAIRDAIPRIQIIVADLLTSRHNLFDESKLDDRYKRPGFAKLLADRHSELIKAVGLPVGGRLGPYGFGGLGLTYGFDHGTPNNSLPLLWCRTDRWTPLLER
jgi:hypothetical protein